MSNRKPRLRLEALEARDVPATYFGGYFPYDAQYALSAGQQQAPPPSGDFVMSGGVAVNVHSGTALSTLDAPAARDVAVEADINIHAWSGLAAGLIARYSGPGEQNFYLAEAHGTPGAVTLSIYRNHAGAYTRLASALVGDATGTLRFEADGPSFRLLLNGELKVSASDTLLDGAGLAGIRASGPAGAVSLTAPHAEALATPDATLGTADAFSGPGRLGREYVTQVGDVVAADGQAANATGAALISMRGVRERDLSVSADIDVAARSGVSVGLVARYSGPGESNFYMAEVYADARSDAVRVSIYLNAGGGYRLLASGAVAGGVSGELTFEVVGSSQKVFLGDTLLASSRDTTLDGAGSAGFRLTGVPGSARLDNLSADRVATPDGALDATDTFSGGRLGREYVTEVGDVVLAAGRAANAGGLSLATLRGVAQKDQVVTGRIDVSSRSGVSVGLVARYSGPGESNFYLAEAYADAASPGVRVSIYLKQSGAYRLLSSTTLAGDARGTLRFEAAGASQRVYLDGALVAASNDGALGGAGSAGFRLGGAAGSATVDDFSVSAPAPPVPPADATLPFSDAFTSGGTLGAMYAEKAGAFRVAGGAATNVTGVAVAVLNGIDQGDMTVMAGVALPFGSGQGVGLLGRYSGDGEGTGYLAEMYAAPGMGGAVAVNIYRRFGGQLLRLATATTALNGGTLEFALKGSALGLYMDGGLLVSVRDTLLERGSAGLRLSGPSVSAYGFAADASPRDVQVTETTASGGDPTPNAAGSDETRRFPEGPRASPRPPEHVLRLL